MGWPTQGEFVPEDESGSPHWLVKELPAVSILHSEIRMPGTLDFRNSYYQKDIENQGSQCLYKRHRKCVKIAGIVIHL